MEFLTCWLCGEVETSDTQMDGGVRFFHRECRKEFEEQKDGILNHYVELKVRVMHERALRMLEKQNAKMNLYLDESEAVLNKALEKPSAFASSHEMIAAMELLRKEIRFKPEHRIGRKRVDFFIPELKVVLEIDGHLHDHSKIKDSERDIEILNMLNEDDPGWEVVRIPTKRIEENSKKLLTAIKTIANYKRIVRKENGGFIPHGNSLREDEHYQKVLKM